MKDLYNYYVHTIIKRHTLPPLFLERSLLTQGFASLYGVSAADAAAITAAGTTAGFKGVVHNDALWVDVDTFSAADETEKRLKELNLDFTAYTTGNRGAHFAITRDAAPSHLLPAQDKRWVQQHLEGLADLSIYTHLHLFRLPGTRHETGGGEKRLVLTHPGVVLTLPAWKKDEGAYGNSNSDDVLSSADAGSIFRSYRVMSNSVPTKVGNRHPTFVKLLHALRDDARVSPAVARWWLGEVNKMAEEPRDDAHLDDLVRSIFA
jgi:hypothetical protein